MIMQQEESACYRVSRRDITMENTALNGTTATQDQEEDWKEKKRYGPIIVAASLALLLGLPFYAGRQVGGAHLCHGEMGMTNAAASSSSSTSLVGSGTATSDLKTLTIAVDADHLVDNLLSGWPYKGGGNSGDKCTKTSDCKIPKYLDHVVCRHGKCFYSPT